MSKLYQLGQADPADGSFREMLVNLAKAPGRRLKRLVPSGSPRCVVLQAAAWVGARPLTAWALVPPESSEEHSDKGLFGLAFAGKLLR